MNDIKYKGKTLSFWELLTNQKIQIPIIQRDYAQGRVDKEELRLNFLNALFKSLNKSEPIKLDFIYGSIKGDVFQPLDGQQRLTTLFLLHWYAAIKEKTLKGENIAALINFSYETRISSREFCNALISNPIIISSDSERIDSQIIDSAWFFLSWKKDPTIDAMLRTINDIHDIFYDINDLWGKLTSENSLISFYHVELENIGLTDDLYIKMNARGKLLSPFENFKASFQKNISEKKWENKQSLTETFASKVDGIWADLFWEHRKENSIDEAFIRFISTIVMVRQPIEKGEDRFGIISRLQDSPNAVKSEMFTEDTFRYLCESFDIYHKIFDEKLCISLPFPLFQHKPNKSIFSSIVYEGNKGSYTQKVLFYAQTEYLRKTPELNIDKFQDWMRVVRNIVSRGDVTKNGKRPPIIRSPQTFDGVINLINELSEGCEDIYSYLSTIGQLKSTFAKEQIEEEKLKSKLIITSINYKKVLFDCEDTNLLQGRIDFALYCIDYDIAKANFNENLLIKIHEVIEKYFKNDADITNELRRALLTISDDNGVYNYYGYWWSFWHVVSTNKRCLIDSFRELEFFIYGNYKNRDCYKLY